MNDIKNVGKNYIELKDKEKAIKKDVKNLNDKIKYYFEETNQTELEIGDKIIVKQVQDRSSINEEKLLEKMKQLNKFETIKTKEVVDVEKVNDLIYEGKLNVEDIADCVNKKMVTTIRIKNNK